MALYSAISLSNQIFIIGHVMSKKVPNILLVKTEKMVEYTTNDNSQYCVLKQILFLTAFRSITLNNIFNSFNLSQISNIRPQLISGEISFQTSTLLMNLHCGCRFHPCSVHRRWVTKHIMPSVPTGRIIRFPVRRWQSIVVIYMITLCIYCKDVGSTYCFLLP